MSTGELSSRPADATSSSRAAPVIVLAYPGSGAVRLQSLLSAFPGMACTNGTGIVPLRGQALTVWQAVDGRSGEGVLAARRRACQGLHRRPVDRDPGPRRRRPLVRAHLRAPGGGRGVRAALPAGPVPDRAPPGRRGGARHPRREPLGPVGPGIRAVRARAPSKHPRGPGQLLGRAHQPAAGIRAATPWIMPAGPHRGPDRGPGAGHARLPARRPCLSMSRWLVAEGAEHERKRPRHARGLPRWVR